MALPMMDTIEIRKYLPQRYPFLLVDRVLELTSGESILAYKNLSANEAFFTGHFPENPIFPGVLMLEALAQTAGILGFYSQGKTAADGTTFYFAGVDNLRFKRPCVPGDRVMLRASIVSARRGLWKFAVSSEVEGELAASATILCADR